MKHGITLFILLFFITKTNAQETALPAGGEATGAGGSMSFSVGQIADQTNLGGGITEAQGVQQPYEISVVTGLSSVGKLHIDMQVFPNPAQNNITLQIKHSSLANFYYTLTDQVGKVISQNKITQSSTAIDVHALAASSYFLSVYADQQLINSFKILKNQ